MKGIDKMESKFQQLNQCLEGFVTILNSTEFIGEPSPSDEHPAPNIELIDFDQLCQVLSETITALDEAQAIKREGEVIRKWLKSRIASLRHGRQALLSQKKSLTESDDLEKTTLPELVRLFEDESARLRSLAKNAGPGKTGRRYHRADDFRQFKS
jgi:hypothetical protein